MIKKNLLPAAFVGALALAASSASAQILWDNDGGDNDLMNQANWGDGASGTPNATSGTYQIDNDTGVITWNTGAAFPNLIRATLNHNTGTVSRGSATAAANIDGTYNLNTGATLDLGSGSNVQVRNGVMNFNGGSLTSSGGNYVVNDADATVNVNADLSTDLYDIHSRGVLNLNADTFTFTGTTFTIGNTNNDPTAFVNVFDGNFATTGGLQFGGFDDVNRSGTMTFDSTGSGNVSATSLAFSANVNNMINFETGTLGSLTIAGFTAGDFEQVWDDGFLFIDGDNTGTFDDSNFQVTGETLSLIPEPGTFALLAGCLALTGVMLRRRD